MEDWRERTERMIGAEAVERLSRARVALFGVGGVGGFAGEALIRAVSKDAEDGIVFIGANAWRVDRMMHVSELMKELITGTEEALKEN